MQVIIQWGTREHGKAYAVYLLKNNIISTSAYITGEITGGAIDENWHHVVSVFDGNKIQIFLDGSLSATSDEIATQTSISPLRLGKEIESPGNWFSGSIDDIRIYDRALSEAEINSLYLYESKRQTKSTPPPHAHAPFDADAAKSYQQAWADQMGLPAEFENSVGMKMRLIPPGQFSMGSGNGHPTERPVHEGHLTRPYYISVHEVTQKEYEKVTGKNPSKWIADKNLVEQVNWSEATQFCQQLSKLPAEQQIGRRYLLPSEAEWEYACRAGTTTPYHFGSDSADLNDHAWHLANSGKQPHPVGQKKPNAWGLFDMHGNVWEWCRDGFDNYTPSRKTNPTGSPSVKRGRVFRGFSCVHTAVECRSSFRGGLDPKLRYDSGGFRVVLPIPDKFYKASDRQKPKSN